MGEGFHLGHIHLAFDVDALGFFGENHGHAEFPGHRIGDGDAGGLNGEHLGNRDIGESAFEFPADLVQQGDIHLVVQKTVHLQNMTGFDNSVFAYSFFKEIHSGTSQNNAHNIP